MKNIDELSIYGAREHNLKDISVSIPRNKMVVITGLSGSGKSSLAFDTIFAEGQRRYIETFSSYARYFLGNIERPDVDEVTGLSPVISIEQKTTNKNPRSTVGTVTEIYDYLRLLYARAGEAYSYVTGEKMVKYTKDQILELVLNNYDGKKIYLLSPLVRTRKGHYKELFVTLRKKGFMNVRIDGELKELTPGMKLDRYKNHDIEVVIDKFKVSSGDNNRLNKSLEIALNQGNGICMILEMGSDSPKYYSRNLMCPTSGIAYKDPAPNNFSFNSPEGMCPRCKGLGVIDVVDIDKIIPDKSISIKDGGIAAIGKYKNNTIFSILEFIAERYGSSIKIPISKMPKEVLNDILYGTDYAINIKNELTGYYTSEFNGIIKYIAEFDQEDETSERQKWAAKFIKTGLCPECHGKKLNKEALHYRINGKSIDQLADMDISELKEWIDAVEPFLSDKQKRIAVEILKEIRSRLTFLLEVGLDYISLSRTSASLSGGETQRIRLATQIGSQLVNVMYILDEPSIGLHQRDNDRLIESLKTLRDKDNSVIVVEHDKDMIMKSDYIVDLGPKAGRHGGEIVFEGTPEEMMKSDTLTAKYIRNELRIEYSSDRRKGNGKKISVKGCCGNNLKNVDVDFDLGKLIIVTGVSGSGKSTLINETLQPVLSQHFYRSLKEPLKYSKIEGIDNIDKIITVDQSPIGKSPRSNAATYTNIFADIRKLYTELPESKIRGYKPGRFSFNVRGGRCEVCKGNGYKTIEMNFLPNVYVKCEECHGKRYNKETLEVKFKGKSIADVLDMTINTAVEFFKSQPHILRKLQVLQEVGLGYIKLGQSSTTLSGGENQRVKLAAELAKKDTGKTLYLLDEPTTGLHFEDINVLMKVVNTLVDKGNTVIIIEHNLDVIKLADQIIDIGPEGGRNGGNLLFSGTPEELVKTKGKSITAKYLAEYLK